MVVWVWDLSLYLSSFIFIMSISHIGELAALCTAFSWTITAMAFEVASKRLGALTVNLLRLFLAFVFLAILNYFSRGYILPVDATRHAWVWLGLSGIVGFVIGDYFLFRSFTIVGSRVSMLIMTLVPPITAIIGWILLNEVMGLLKVGGMLLTIAGVSIVIFGKPDKNGKWSFRHPLKGILLALGGAAGQAVGLVLSKYGMGDYNAFAATQIRIIAGAIGFSMVFLVTNRWHLVKKAMGDKKGLRPLVLGSIFGPFIGVSLSLFSVQHTVTGIAATIMSIVPILIIPPAIILLKQKVGFMEIVGAVISVIGVGMMFL